LQHTTNEVQQREHIVCQCLQNISNILAPIADKSGVDFGTVLDICNRINVEWEKPMSCSNCSTNFQTGISLSKIADQVLTLYEAAWFAYIPQEDHPGDSQDQFAQDRNSSSMALELSSRGHDHGLQNFHTCTKTDMFFGELRLDSAEGTKLARLLLMKNSAKLSHLLENLKQVMGNMWVGNWTQQHSGIAVCEASIARTTDRAVSLVGFLR
jgi:hypothetical protein